ncbi:MAG: TlpA family protein disulfide reductase, partial [Prolixibacteraceae bacterium]|nr:TlpA family protein disulfide reductase [Prolixibacteraceae bacterium]
PDFSYQTGNGTEKKLSDLKGKVVLITFFATWCGPCRAELPHIQKEIYNRLKDNADFELLIIGREHSRDEVNQFKTEQQFAMPFYPDEERKIYSLYAQQSIPRNFVVDKNGKIAYLSIGFNKAEFEKMKAKIDRLLAD